jgi:hypothetical protein
MDEPQTGSERPPFEPQIETAGQSEQEQATGITGKIDQAASRARDAVTGAKETVVGTVTTQGEHAIEKVKEAAHNRGHGEGLHPHGVGGCRPIIGS